MQVCRPVTILTGMSNQWRFTVATLLAAFGSAASASGNLFVGDASDGSIARFDATTGTYQDRQFLTGTFGGNPVGMTFGLDHNLYVVDSSNGTVERFDGNTGVYMNQFVAPGGLSNPSGIAFGPDGNMYVSDYGSNGAFINRYDGTTGAFINQLVAPGAGPGFGGLGQPPAMTFGTGGNLYVSDGVNGIMRYNVFTNAGDIFIPVGNPPSPLSGPEALAFGADGDLYVADVTQSAVLRFDASGAYLGEFVPSAGGPLVQPIGLAFGPNGDLFVADGQGRVAEFDSITGAYLSDFVPIGGSAGPLVNPQFMAFQSVPEPATMVALGAGLLGFVRSRKRRA